MQATRTIADSIRDDPLVEGRKFSAARFGQSQKIGIAHLGGVQEARDIEYRAVQNGYVVGPPNMAW